MSIRSDALTWLSSNFGKVEGQIYTSKYYTPEESWPKTHVWWLKVPINVIETNQRDFINLICQVAPNKNDFHYLKVPVKFLREHLGKFDIVQNKMIHLYLSADPTKLFMEERGSGSLNFSVFLVS
jgi:hypothetical protein